MSVQRTMILIWALAVVALLMAAGVYHNMHTSFFITDLSTVNVRVGPVVVQAHVADTPALHRQGLSGRGSLQDNEGMLFIFEEEGTHPIWMKDMSFAIDILWADADGTIITVKENVSPATYPEAFSADEATAVYVLEVPAGFVHRAEVAEGAKIVVQ